MTKTTLICDGCGTSCDQSKARAEKWIDLNVSGQIDEREHFYWRKDYCGTCAPRVIQAIKANFRGTP